MSDEAKKELNESETRDGLLERLWTRHYSKMVFISFWILGFCNPFPNLIYLTAAHDLLTMQTGDDSTYNKTNNLYDCNNYSTGIILLVDVVPGIFIKLIVPFFIYKMPYWQRLIIIVFGMTLSFSIVAFGNPQYLGIILTGVVFASLSTSFGEITNLSLTTLYPTKLSFSGYSSGTGTSGIVATFIYASLTSFGLSPQATVAIMLIVPFIMMAGFLIMPPENHPQQTVYIEANKEKSDELNKFNEANDSDEELSFLNKLRQIIPLLKYMIPLFIVYFSEYVINQGLYELLYFKNEPTLADHSLQYRWYNVVFRFGIFIARSSIYFIRIRYLPLFSLFQITNLFVMATQVLYGYIKYIWIVIGIILWEGLIGGGAYANAFYMISNEQPKNARQFSMAITALSDSIAVALAGVTSVLLHQQVCTYGKL